MANAPQSKSLEREAAKRIWGNAKAGAGTVTRMLAELLIAGILASPALLFGYWPAALAAIAFLAPVHFAWSAWTVTRDIYYEALAIKSADPSRQLAAIRESVLHFATSVPGPLTGGTEYEDRLRSWYDGADAYLQSVLKGHKWTQFHSMRTNAARTADIGVAILRNIADTLEPRDLR